MLFYINPSHAVPLTASSTTFKSADSVRDARVLPLRNPNRYGYRGYLEEIVEKLDKLSSLAMQRSEIHLAELSAKGHELESLHGRTGSITSHRMSIMFLHMGCAWHIPTGIASGSVLVL